MIELQRCRDSDSVSEVEGVLSAAGVAYKLVSTAPNFDLSATGSESDAQVIVRVPRAQYDEARAAMEKHCAGIELPEDHYLQVGLIGNTNYRFRIIDYNEPLINEC